MLQLQLFHIFTIGSSCVQTLMFQCRFLPTSIKLH